MLRALILLAGMALLVPGVAAQVGGKVELSIDAPQVPIKPEIENPAFLTHLTISCDVLLQHASPTSPTDPVHVQFTFQAAGGIVITGPLDTLVDPQQCLAPMATEVVHDQAFQVSVARTAPGLEAAPVEGRATLMAQAPGGQSFQSNIVTFPVTPDYYSVSEVKMPTKLKQCQDGRAAFDLEVVNYGNARTQYIFELASQPGGGWDAQPPEPLLLDTPNVSRGPTSAIVTFHVVCDSGNKEGSFQLVLRPSAAEDPTKQGDPITANVLARSRPFDGALPAPAGPWALLVVLGAALLARRRA